MWQKLALSACGCGLIAGMVVAPATAAASLMIAVGGLFIAAVALRCLALMAVGVYDVERTGEPCAATPADPPRQTYAILVPLYREAEIAADLIDALAAIDYPVDLLDIVLICEADDRQTLDAITLTNPPPHMRLVTVPMCPVRTKPKALNYALQSIEAEFLVVYDAEDVPHPRQLRDAIGRFAISDPAMACLQARLTIHNWRETWLTRQFALEYGALFEGLLPALEMARLPIPLGGTSNHFRVEALRRVGAWDAHNVTEDADLGMRLVRFGYRVQVLASDTEEEAPAKFPNWLRQRTRWIKGWLQTYAVHTRRPLRSMREFGPWRWVGFHVLTLGLLASVLLYPLGLALLAAELSRTTPFQGVDRAHQLLLIASALMVTVGAVSALGLAAAAAVGRGRFRLLLSVPLMPIYWLLISVAGYRALWQLWRGSGNTALWEKTTHRRRTAAP